MDSKNIRAALEKYGAETVVKMAKAISDTALSKKLTYRVRQTKKGPELTFSMPVYADYVDQGRYPWGIKGKIKDIPVNRWNKFPPPDAINAWAKSKGLSQFRDSKGRFASNDTRTFLISRSIAARGIKPRPFISIIYRDLQQLYSDVGSAAATDFAVALQKNFDDAGIGKES